MVAQFPPGPGTAPLPRVPAAPRRTGYVVKACGLVAVAVLSGLVWYLARHKPAPPMPPPGTRAKEFSFAMAEGPVVSSNCAANSTGQVKKFFTDHPCQRLARALYNTAYGNDQVLVSVMVVTTADSSEAQQLKAIADRDGTGNINDLLKDGTAHIPSAPNKLSEGKYASKVTGNEVTIVLSEFYDGHSDDAVLGRVDNEALNLGSQLG
ncbi:hypothetical protein [Amycolatopsis taiwanensis]|uniref:Uncharacterized protein n=1 Tax=Amycolatopsis taiwanensis TaxID=342230 RepID=A0A9W6R577_9PSEU|nr:hypothetical protein [Amycolatopsis taiwanensis]GLY69329.1 hypothetical protein Atai01_59480 [Amycolatopsis taiwanensis]